MESVVLNNLANDYIQRGDFRRAVRYISQSLAIAHEMGDRSLVADFSGSMGQALAGQGDYARAAEFMQILVDYYHAINHPNANHYDTVLTQIQARVADNTIDK